MTSPSVLNVIFLLFIYLFRPTVLEIFRATVFLRQPRNENQLSMMLLVIRPASQAMSVDNPPQPPDSLKNMEHSKLIFNQREVWEDHLGRVDG